LLCTLLPLTAVNVSFSVPYVAFIVGPTENLFHIEAGMIDSEFVLFFN
jgi:hypothetical protein